MLFLYQPNVLLNFHNINLNKIKYSSVFLIKKFCCYFSIIFNYYLTQNLFLGN